MTSERMQYTSKLRAVHGEVSSRTRRRFLLASVVGGAFVSLLLAVPGHGQTGQLANPAVRTQPSSGVPVHIVVTVEARKGDETPLINREDVMVHEGHTRDEVVDWVPALGKHASLELIILLDDGSNTILGTQLDDIRKFINSQPETTLVGVAYMRDGIAQVVQNLTSDHALAAKAVRLPLGVRGVNGSPYFSLTDLVKRWPAPAVAPVVRTGFRVFR